MASLIYAAATGLVALDPIPQSAGFPPADDFEPQIQLKAQEGFSYAYVRIFADGSTTADVEVLPLVKGRLPNGYSSAPARSAEEVRLTGWGPGIVAQSPGVTGEDLVVAAGASGNVGNMLVALPLDGAPVGVAIFNSDPTPQEGLSYVVQGIPEAMPADAFRTLLESYSPLPFIDPDVLASLASAATTFDDSYTPVGGTGVADSAKVAGAASDAKTAIDNAAAANTGASAADIDTQTAAEEAAATARLAAAQAEVGALEPSLVGSEGANVDACIAQINTFSDAFADGATGLRAVIAANEDNGGGSGWPAYPNGAGGSDPATDTVDLLLAYLATM